MTQSTIPALTFNYTVPATAGNTGFTHHYTYDVANAKWIQQGTATSGPLLVNSTQLATQVAMVPGATYILDDGDVMSATSITTVLVEIGTVINSYTTQLTEAQQAAANAIAEAFNNNGGARQGERGLGNTPGLGQTNGPTGPTAEEIRLKKEADDKLAKDAADKKAADKKAADDAKAAQDAADAANNGNNNGGSTTTEAPEPVVQEPAPEPVYIAPFIEVGKDGKTYFDNGSLQKANNRFDQIESLTKELKPFLDNGQIMTVEIERAVDSAIAKGTVAKVDYKDMKVGIVVDKGIIADDAVVLHNIDQHKVDFNGKSLVNTLTSKDHGTFDFNAIQKIVQIAIVNDGTDQASFSDVFRSDMMEFAIAELNNGVKNELDAIEVAWGNVYQFNNVCELVGVTLDQGILAVAGFDGNFVGN